jgi:hypothetical protein
VVVPAEVRQLPASSRESDMCNLVLTATPRSPRFGRSDGSAATRRAGPRDALTGDRARERAGGYGPVYRARYRP